MPKGLEKGRFYLFLKMASNLLAFSYHDIFGMNA